MNHIDLEAIALKHNSQALTCPLVEQGMVFDALKLLISSLHDTVYAIDRSQRPAEPACGEPGNSWYFPAHEPKPLTYAEQRLIAGYFMAREAILVAAIRHPDYSHSRTRGGGGSIPAWTAIYHRDPTSPSGVFCVAEDRADKVDPLIRKWQNNSPLSPTEGLRTAR